MNWIRVASAVFCLPITARAVSVCQILEQAPRLAGTTVVLDAVFDGGVSQGYELFDLLGVLVFNPAVVIQGDDGAG